MIWNTRGEGEAKITPVRPATFVEIRLWNALLALWPVAEDQEAE